MDPICALLDVLEIALKQAVPEVEGRVYLRRSVPRQMKELSFIQISLGDELIDMQDEAPPVAKRTRSFSVTPVVRGDTEEAYAGVLALRERIHAIMREIQMVPGGNPGDPCLVDEIMPTGESEPGIFGSGDKFYSGLSLTYEAVYVTEEGSLGEAGPGVPAVNVLGIFRQAASRWKARRSGQVLEITDHVQL